MHYLRKLARTVLPVSVNNSCRCLSIFPKFGKSDNVEEKISPKRAARVYGCGVVVTGALGVKKYVEPEGLNFNNNNGAINFSQI